MSVVADCVLKIAGVHGKSDAWGAAKEGELVVGAC